MQQLCCHLKLLLNNVEIVLLILHKLHVKLFGFLSVASRVAEEIGVKLGEEVGYIRFEDITNAVSSFVCFHLM